LFASPQVAHFKGTEERGELDGAFSNSSASGQPSTISKRTPSFSPALLNPFVFDNRQLKAPMPAVTVFKARAPVFPPFKYHKRPYPFPTPAINRREHRLSLHHQFQ